MRKECEALTVLDPPVRVDRPASFDVCHGIVAPGGRITNLGVHGRPVELHVERLWSHNITQ